jgi:hypothetical protein
MCFGIGVAALLHPAEPAEKQSHSPPWRIERDEIARRWRQKVARPPPLYVLPNLPQSA